MRDLLEPYEHKLPEDLENASLTRILRAVGQQGTSASKQGVVVGSAHPWWRIVARLDAKDRLEYVVVDVMPATKGHPPVEVHGPVKKRDEAQRWANNTAAIYLQTTGTYFGPEWPWE